MSALRQLCQDILAAMRKGRLLSSRTFALDVDALLDKRDNSAFERDLVSRSDIVWAMKRQRPAAEVEYIEEFVGGVFEFVFLATESDDLSAYISDDFGLFIEALHVGYEDGWLNGLADAYRGGCIPCEPISPVPGKLYDHVAALAE